MKASIRMKAIKNLQQLFKGTGWVSLTQLAKELSVERIELETLATKMNLTISRHGKYGVVATK